MDQKFIISDEYKQMYGNEQFLLYDKRKSAYGGRLLIFASEEQLYIFTFCFSTKVCTS